MPTVLLTTLSKLSMRNTGKPGVPGAKLRTNCQLSRAGTADRDAFVHGQVTTGHDRGRVREIEVDGVAIHGIGERLPQCVRATIGCTRDGDCCRVNALQTGHCCAEQREEEKNSWFEE